MSATQDKSQKVTFIYSNIYSVYRKGVERAREGAAQAADASKPSLAAEALQQLAAMRPSQSGVVLKSGQGAPQVRPYTPAELIGKRVARPVSLPAVAKREESPVEDLKHNLKSLEDIQTRLRVMLKELEDLIKE